MSVFYHRVYPVLNPAAFHPKPLVGILMLHPKQALQNDLQDSNEVALIDICKHCCYAYCSASAAGRVLEQSPKQAVCAFFRD
jgi:hypothetical protein